MPIISFVILTYNSEAYIESLINSILKFYKEDIDKNIIEIVIVDNNSSDKTVSLAKKFNNLRIIENKENLGFSKGINLGVSRTSSEFVAILNPDTRLQGGDFFKTVEMFNKDEKLGVIGGKILNKDGKEEKSTGRFLKTFEVFLMALGLDELFGIRSSPNKLKDVDFVSGGFMIVRKKLFEKLSGFDENFFMYVEDMEFCYRVKNEGHKVLFDPSIIFFHFAHGSSSRGFAIKNIYKGLIYFQKKHGNYLSLFMVRLMLNLKAKLLVLFGRITGSKYLIETYSRII
ncbi:MAG: glycosyltransferase family 2 protein [Patescibacteria group bacterium]